MRNILGVLLFYLLNKKADEGHRLAALMELVLLIAIPVTLISIVSMFVVWGAYPHVTWANDLTEACVAVSCTFWALLAIVGISSLWIFFIVESFRRVRRLYR